MFVMVHRFSPAAFSQRGPLNRRVALRAATCHRCFSVSSSASVSADKSNLGTASSASSRRKGARPVAKLKEALPRKLQLDMGHPWVYDDEVANISELNGTTPGSLVDLVDAEGGPLGVGVLNRKASIVIRRLHGLRNGEQVTEEMLRGRLRTAFAARASWPLEGFGRAVHGEHDGLPGIFVDRYGSAAVMTLESVGSSRLEFLVQEELSRWMKSFDVLAVHRMSSVREKWAQDGAEFVTTLARGNSSRISVSEPPCVFEFDVHQGVAGHWNYSLEELRRGLVQQVAREGTILDAWSHSGQWGVRCAKAGASEVVLLEDSLGFAKLSQDNVSRNEVGVQCTVLHRSDVQEELQNMVTSGIKFTCVALNVRVRYERYYKQRRGQFGRWFKPTLKGYENAIRSGALVTARGGYLVVTFVLPASDEHWAASLLQTGLERASRVGSLVYHRSAVSDDSALASSSMDDAWVFVVVAARLN